VVYYPKYYTTPHLFYLPVGGYDNIEAMKAAMIANEHDSRAKAELEAWFEEENLDGHIAGTRNYEDDLEDAVFCNDRSYASGSLSGKDASWDYSPHPPYVRSQSSNFIPVLECPNVRDAFTKEAANGNGKLKHKVGLVTADELELSGMVEGTAFSWSNYGGWMLASASFDSFAHVTVFTSYVGYSHQVIYAEGIRPVVSLKAGTSYVEGGDGTRNNPYVIE
jgi:hypothetical protein